MNLSPQQLHYFKRELVSVSLSKELEEFKQAPLAHLIQEDSPFPFLHFFFVRLVSPFPLLKKTDNSFWTQVETFWKAYQALTKDNYSPHQQNAPLLAYKLNHLLVIFLTNMIKTTQGEEESIDIRQDLLDDLDLAELESEENYMAWIGIEAPEIKLIGVRKRSHDEFLIKVDEVVVARRYGQFRQLQKDLLLLDQDVPELPNKARDPSYGSTKDCLYREKDRISLRLFLHQIANSELAQTKVFERFLTEDPIVLTMEEEVEIEERESMDRKRAQEEKKFRLQVDKKMVELDGLLSMMKTKVMQPKGLLEVFDVIKHTKDIGQLPDELKKAIEWGRIK
ncbi:hypothetical protein G6F56_004541 [Rhizopus delemar]|uniref:PX domain-containing protein n=1 Tax=Rhizopus stolonifer TaxID=4846 RepID=A0A367KKN3_RHIST|nr:hypothetical protein G6F56_004541 [Rhizopus delemar]RCI02793.1 hypothetical protein CU098_012319 [Rhizopus stolonifer]